MQAASVRDENSFHSFCSTRGTFCPRRPLVGAGGARRVVLTEAQASEPKRLQTAATADKVFSNRKRRFLPASFLLGPAPLGDVLQIGSCFLCRRHLNVSEMSSSHERGKCFRRDLIPGVEAWTCCRFSLLALIGNKTEGQKAGGKQEKQIESRCRAVNKARRGL